MKAVVVYESLWGNTASIARAIAEGIGADARALSTAEASAETLAGADLVVAGAPVLGFQLPTSEMRDSLKSGRVGAPSPPDLSHPAMRSWLDGLPHAEGWCASFETRLRWSPGGATKAIDEGLRRAGYSSIADAKRFIVAGSYGPLREGELERAHAWGGELAALVPALR